MKDKVKEKLIEMCVEIYACSELDYEVTLGGNGTNAAEAANVAGEILDIIGVKDEDGKFEKMVSDRVKELKKEYGDNEDEDDESEDNEVEDEDEQN